MYNRTFRILFAFCPLFVILFLCLGCGGSPKIQNSICSACEFVYATTNSAQILTFPIDRLTGSLGAPISIAGPANSGGLVTLAPANVAYQVYLYASDPQDGAIHVYRVHMVDGTLAPASVGPFPLGNGFGTPGEMAAFGNILYVASSTGSIFAFTENADGSLTSVPGSPFAAGAGASHLTANGAFLYAANSNDPSGSISAFSIAANGALVPVPGSPFPTLSGAGPEGISGGGAFLYVALKNANAVAAFAVASDGSLSPITGSPFPAGRGTFSLSRRTNSSLPRIISTAPYRRTPWTQSAVFSHKWLALRFLERSPLAIRLISMATCLCRMPPRTVLVSSRRTTRVLAR